MEWERGLQGRMACSSWGQDLAPLGQGRPVPGRLVPAPPALGQLGLEQLDPGRPVQPVVPAAGPASAVAAVAVGAIAAASGTTAAVVAPRLATSCHLAPLGRPGSVFRQFALFVRVLPRLRQQPGPVEGLLAYQAPSAVEQGRQASLAERAQSLAAEAEARQPERQSGKI